MKISQTKNAVDAEQQDFHLRHLARVARGHARFERGQVGANGVELSRRHTAPFERGDPLPEVGGRRCPAPAGRAP